MSELRNEWLPMYTAPKDGQVDILCYAPGNPRAEAAEAERDRLWDALVRCQAVGCSQVKEIVRCAISSLPISDCSCKIEMGSFRFRGSHCTVCGGVIG